MKKNIRRRFLAGFAALALLLTACGSDNAENAGNDKEVQAGASKEQDAENAEKWVYVPEYLEIDAMGSFYSMQQVGDFLYYPTNNWDEATGTSASGLSRYSVEDGSVEELPLKVEGGTLNNFTVGEDGSVYAMSYHWSWDEATGESRSWQALEKYDAAGGEVYQTDLADLMARENVEYFSGLAADSQGRVYLASESKVLLFDAQGNSVGSVGLGDGSMGSRVSSIGMGKDGKVYVCLMSNGTSCNLTEIDFDKRAAGVSYEQFPGSRGNSLNSGIEKDFLVHDGSVVYDYDLGANAGEQLFSWIDCDINGSNVTSVGATSEGKIVAVINDWSTNEGSVVLLTKTRADEVAQKETIVLGTISTMTDMQAAVVDFNKTSDKYRVTIKDYMGSAEWNNEALEDAKTRLSLELASDSGPDIIDMTFMGTMGMDALASQGMLEDLDPYLEQSSVLGKDDFVENMLEGNMYDGKLMGVSRRFVIQTLAGRASEVGTEMGWNLDELIALADKYPDRQLFEYCDKSNALSYCMRYGQDAFVDWETGECSFNSPEFIRLLEFANRFEGQADYDSSESSASKIQRGDIVLGNVNLASFDDVQMYNEIFKGDVNFIGYPTVDGSVGCSLNLSDVCGISVKSQHKDGAWAFLESYLTAENNDNMWAFPTNKTRLEEMREEAVKVEYLTDENGEKILDENGDPIPQGGTSTVTYSDGWSYTYHPTTAEEADLVMELIKIAKTQRTSNGEINSIIFEEADSFFNGSKKAQEVADIIQRRVQMYVSENS